MKVHTLIVVSSSPHTAGSGYVFERYAGDSERKLILRSSRFSDFGADTGWTKCAMLRAGILEPGKLVAYRLWH